MGVTDRNIMASPFKSWHPSFTSIQNWLCGQEFSLLHRYTREIPDLVYHPVWWRCQPWGSNWGVPGVCRQHTQKQTQNKCVHDLFAVFFECLSSHSDCSMTYAPDEPRLFWLQENQKKPNLSPLLGWKWRRFWDLRCRSVIYYHIVCALKVFQLCCFCCNTIGKEKK